jgi:hypothetical protein
VLYGLRLELVSILSVADDESMMWKDTCNKNSCYLCLPIKEVTCESIVTLDTSKSYSTYNKLNTYFYSFSMQSHYRSS